MERVALYIRVSTDEQAINGDSLRTQRDELTKYAKKNNYNIIDIYEDDGFSATNLKRPALQRMLEDVKLKKIDRILITKLDRLSRGVRNYYKILDILDDNGVFWSTIFEKYDSSTANGRLHINIMLSVAENESAQTSERIKSVFKTKLQNKEIVSGKIPIGYKKDGKKLVIDEDKKQFVIDTFDFYIKTNSIYKTFDHLTVNYFEMNYMRTLRLLTNKLYIGIKETPYGEIKGYCEPIISEEVFDKVQRLMKINERKRISGADCYIFKGLLRCSECEFLLGGKFYRNNVETSKYYYICRNHHMNKKCSCGKNFNEHTIELLLLNNIDKYITDYVKECETIEKQIHVKDNEKEKKQINKQLEKLRDLYLRDMIQIEHYEKQYKELTLKLNELNYIKDEPQKTYNVKDLKSFLNSDFKLNYNKFTRSEKRRVWTSIIDTIYIDKDYNMKIVFI
jgi:DNA invertase Pin-like site-specific DNA recombinase